MAPQNSLLNNNHTNDEDSHFVQVETPNSIPAGTAGDNTFFADHTKYLSDAPKITLEWDQLTTEVTVEDPLTKTSEKKTILKSVHGFAKPGELLVIMGPSGAGKTTLLDCISGRKPATSGNITINGAQWSADMKRFAAYVMQDDLFHATITVKEHLVFQARLTLGGKLTKDQYMRRVETVMEELGLTKSRDTLIGGGMLRGISGGERKRLAFASEILTNPSILFVDEPTSGLDSYTARTVVNQLEQLAKAGRTVITTIHQPSSEVFALFDQLYLLSDGATVYHGKASESVSYFGALGYQCPTFANPADYFMDQLVVMDADRDRAGVERIKLLQDAWNKHSKEEQRSAAKMLPASEEPIPTEYEDTRERVWGQIAVLSHRNVLRMLRDKMSFPLELGQVLLVSIILGCIYFQLDMTQNGIGNFSGAFFFIAIDQVYSASFPILVSVPMEVPIVHREFNFQLYRLSAWYFAKMMTEVPQQLVLPFVGFTLDYLFVGIGHGFAVYLKMLLHMILLHSTSAGFGYFISCLSPRADVAPIIAGFVLMPFMLFGGMFVNAADVLDVFSWIRYISPIKYGYEGFMRIFWRAVDEIPCDAALVTAGTCTARTGLEVLDNYGISNRSMWMDALMLVVLNVALRLLGFVCLKFNIKRQ